uniref:Uncharacterized protein n=1 Tax=Tanacetum cinerariifolium TaxID=118510 RepID=A0A6L2NBW1_TANCI|nr:hypothetical protein [Tanacetum cinerariifolium]
MGIEGIAKVARGWFLGCDLSLDYRKGEEDNEQCRDTVHFRDQSLHVSRPSRLCAQAQSGDDTPFCKQACTELVILQRVQRIILVILPKHPSDAYVFTMKMEILLESTSNKLMVDSEDKGDGEEDLGLNISGEERHDEEEEEDELYRDSDRLRKEAQRENDEFLKTIDENIKKIIKEQVKEQVQAQVSKILPRIEQAVNKKLEAEVVTRSSHSSRTFYALVEAYESNKILFDTYGETVTLKRRRDDDEDKNEEPSAGPDRGSKRRREGKEPESASTPSKIATKSTCRSTKGSRSQHASASESAFAEEPVQTTSQMENPSYIEFDTDNRGCRVIPFAHFINNDLEYLWGGASSRKYTTSVTKTKAADYGHIKWIEDLMPRTMWIQEPIDYDKHAL